MGNLIRLLAAATVAFSFSMCTNNSEIPVESNWELEYIYSEGNAMEPPQDHNATLAFLKDSKIAGETGCNRFFGEYKSEGNSLSFDKVGSTRMMCPQMQFETAWLDAIARTGSFEMDQDQMILKDSTGNIIALLKKIAPQALEN